MCFAVRQQLLHSNLCEVVHQGSLAHKDLQQNGILEGVFLIQVLLNMEYGF